MSVRVSAAERNALYDHVFVRLSGIDSLWFAAQNEEWKKADRLAREYIDDLRLLLGDLGWGEGSGEALQLRTPSDVLRRILTRMQDQAEAEQKAEEEGQWEEVRLREERERLMQTCRRVLAEL